MQHSGWELPLFLAVPVSAFDGILSESIGIYARGMGQFKIMVFDPGSMRIVEWI
jgi:hypothetical protein